MYVKFLGNKPVFLIALHLQSTGSKAGTPVLGVGVGVLVGLGVGVLVGVFVGVGV
jgi:hypothetical protein